MTTPHRRDETDAAAAVDSCYAELPSPITRIEFFVAARAKFIDFLGVTKTNVRHQWSVVPDTSSVHTNPFSDDDVDVQRQRQLNLVVETLAPRRTHATRLDALLTVRARARVPVRADVLFTLLTNRRVAIETQRRVFCGARTRAARQRFDKLRTYEVFHTTLDAKFLTQRRELITLRYVRHDTPLDAPRTLAFVEFSFNSESTPVEPGHTRGALHQCGWMLECTEHENVTAVTHVFRLDAKGWKSFAHMNIENAATARANVLALYEAACEVERGGARLPASHRSLEELFDAAPPPATRAATSRATSPRSRLHRSSDQTPLVSTRSTPSSTRPPSPTFSRKHALGALIHHARNDADPRRRSASLTTSDVAALHSEFTAMRADESTAASTTPPPPPQQPVALDVFASPRSRRASSMTLFTPNSAPPPQASTLDLLVDATRALKINDARHRDDDDDDDDAVATAKSVGARRYNGAERVSETPYGFGAQSMNYDDDDDTVFASLEAELNATAAVASSPSAGALDAALARMRALTSSFTPPSPPPPPLHPHSQEAAAAVAAAAAAAVAVAAVPDDDGTDVDTLEAEIAAIDAQRRRQRCLTIDMGARMLAGMRALSPDGMTAAAPTPAPTPRAPTLLSTIRRPARASTLRPRRRAVAPPTLIDIVAPPHVAMLTRSGRERRDTPSQLMPTAPAPVWRRSAPLSPRPQSSGHGTSASAPALAPAPSTEVAAWTPTTRPTRARTMNHLARRDTPPPPPAWRAASVHKTNVQPVLFNSTQRLSCAGSLRDVSSTRMLSTRLEHAKLTPPPPVVLDDDDDDDECSTLASLLGTDDMSDDDGGGGALVPSIFDGSSDDDDVYM